MFFLQTKSVNFPEKSWAPSLALNFKTKNGRQRDRQVLCMSVQQASAPKVAVTPLELEDAKDPPLNLYKPKEPYTATIVSVERLVGPKAPGETCHIVIDHGGNLPYWEGQSYGVIPPVSRLVLTTLSLYIIMIKKHYTNIAPLSHILQRFYNCVVMFVG